MAINCMSLVQNFPEVSFPRINSRASSWFPCNPPQCNTQRPYCGQFVYWCLCLRLWYGPLRTHTPYMLIHYYLWCIFTSSSLSISCDTSHDRCWDIPKLFSTLISIYLELSHGTYAVNSRYDTEHTGFETTTVSNMRVVLVWYTVSHVCLSGNQQSGETPNLTLIMGQCYNKDFVFAWVLCLVLRMESPSVLWTPWLLYLN